MKLIPIFVSILVTALIMFFVIASAQAQDSNYYGAPPADDYYSPPPSSYAKPSAFDGISYDFFDIGYRYFTYDEAFLKDDSHGFEANLSFDILWIFFVETSFAYTNAKADASQIGDLFDFNTDSNYSRFEIGPGIHLPIHPNFNLVLSAGYQYASQDFNFDREAREIIGNYIDGSGLYVKPGVRMKFGNLVELGAYGEWNRYSSSDKGTWGASTDLILWPAKWIGISGHAEFREDVNSYGIGLRLSWD
jgi:hypothetical protein